MKRCIAILAGVLVFAAIPAIAEESFNGLLLERRMDKSQKEPILIVTSVAPRSLAAQMKFEAGYRIDSDTFKLNDKKVPTDDILKLLRDPKAGAYELRLIPYDAKVQDQGERWIRGIVAEVVDGGKKIRFETNGKTVEMEWKGRTDMNTKLVFIPKSAPKKGK